MQVQIPDYKQGLTVIILTSTNGKGCVAGRFSLQVGGSAVGSGCRNQGQLVTRLEAAETAGMRLEEPAPSTGSSMGCEL